MNKNLIWAWAIKNSIAIIAWTVLAIVFHKFWIALFGLLFLSGLKTTYNPHRICDGCGMRASYTNAANAKLTGWLHIAEGNLDYCPDCRKENNKCKERTL